ncbi:MAG TPA: DnaJ domain-containing protein [Candidatus Nitrosotenuis sp.]|nr:DnaJ domain-containing protein [Candidatus Nitrosotenuis sp.]
MDASQAYEVLQLKHNSSFNEIKYAYRKLALELHPDKNNVEKDGTKFKLVTEAYHVLKHTNKVTNAKFREPASDKKYSEVKTKKEKTFSRTSWGARPDDGPPQEDWTRYTKQTEQSDPFFWKSYVAEFWKNYEAKNNQAKNPYDFEIIDEVKKEPDLSVDVDHSRCIGCCSCETIAPQVFSVDKITKMNPKSSVINRKGAKVDKIMDAAQTCPTKAINVDEKETGRRLYPY